jgi:acetolactate synthase-1/2/3 large subunit
MNGAQSLVKTLLAGDVDVCFANPGTSEMHFVAALDDAPDMRCVLCLFEGVATGAADGYARMIGKPAATLLHLGPGLANGLANIHNAKKARTPMVNIVGEHARYHIEYDAPLTADIEATAQPYSHWVRTAKGANTVAADGAAAIAAARRAPGQIATLILPGDTAWAEADVSEPTKLPKVEGARLPIESRIRDAHKVLTGDGPCLLLLTGSALTQTAQLAAARMATATGADLLTATSNSRLERGAGCVALDRVPYPVDEARACLAKYRHIILVCAKPPVAFFAYPDKPSLLAPDDCEFHILAEPDEDGEGALSWLAEELRATKVQPSLIETLSPPALPNGDLTADKIATAVASMLPENAIISDESVSVGRKFFSTIHDVPRHSWLQIMGGAIGLGMPLAAGAAVACPERKVISLQADGSAMYTVQALWTQAREQLDVTTIILSNRAYAILKGEMRNVGVGELGPKATAMLELNRPDLDWVAIANGMGVEASRATSAEAFSEQLARGLASPAPYLIEAVL